MVYSSFASLSGKVFALRHSSADEGDRTRQHSDILQSVQRVKTAISTVKSQHANAVDAQDFSEYLHISRVFEIEILCQKQEWDRLLGVLHERDPVPPSLETFEAIADVLWAEESCPVNVLYAALEAILRSCLDDGSLSVEKFARWLRAICSILLSRNSQVDRTKAISYVEQALTVMEGQSDSAEPSESYPLDESHWLMSTSYNTGVECLAASCLDEAKRWFEAATVVCRFVPDGQRHAEKISDTYRHLLEQYGSVQQ